MAIKFNVPPASPFLMSNFAQLDLPLKVLIVRNQITPNGEFYV